MGEFACGFWATIRVRTFCPGSIEPVTAITLCAPVSHLLPHVSKVVKWRRKECVCRGSSEGHCGTVSPCNMVVSPRIRR